MEKAKEYTMSALMAIVLVSAMGLGMAAYEKYEESNNAGASCGEYKQIMVAGKLQTIKVAEACPAE